MRRPADTPAETYYVVTGFEPFGDHDYNPSYDTARALAAVLGSSARCLPVAFTTAAHFAAAHLEAAHPLPLCFIHLGLAGDRSVISLEARGVNERGDTPDNLEKTLTLRRPRGPRPLVQGGLDQYESDLPLAALRDQYQALREGSARQDELPDVELSKDCGRYVCNALLYHSLRTCDEARASGQLARACFIHIPALSPEAARSVGDLLGRAFAASLTG